MAGVDWWGLLNQALEYSLGLILPTLIGAAVVWVSGLLPKFKACLDAKAGLQVANLIAEAARVAVIAAEQVGLSGQLVDMGMTKIEYAVDVAETWLESRNVFIDLDIIVSAIEAAVLEELNWDKTSTAKRMGEAEYAAG